MTGDSARDAKRTMQWVDRDTLLYDRLPRILAITWGLGLMAIAAIWLLLELDASPLIWFAAGMVVSSVWRDFARRIRTW